MQRQVFDVIHKWFRDYVKSCSAKFPSKLFRFFKFLTGGGGVGKSHTIKTIYMANTKLLMHKVRNPEKARIIVLAPTGVSAVNINVTTIRSDLGINFGTKMLSLNDRQRASLRNKLSEVRFLIIDDIFMVSSMLFYQVNQRLNETFGCPDSAFFVL